MLKLQHYPAGTDALVLGSFQSSVSLALLGALSSLLHIALQEQGDSSVLLTMKKQMSFNLGVNSVSD